MRLLPALATCAFAITASPALADPTAGLSSLSGGSGCGCSDGSSLLDLGGSGDQSLVNIVDNNSLANVVDNSLVNVADTYSLVNVVDNNSLVQILGASNTAVQVANNTVATEVIGGDATLVDGNQFAVLDGLNIQEGESGNGNKGNGKGHGYGHGKGHGSK